MRHALFITATDTGVGKTAVTACLAMTLRRLGHSVGVMKPVETGVVEGQPSDAVRLRQAAQALDSLDLVRPYKFRLPLAPLDAARAERRMIRQPTILKAFHTLQSRHDLLLVEGVGGLHVPITGKTDVLDLITTLKAPVLVVGRAALGGVNHALLTLNALHARRIPVIALVLNRTTPDKTELEQRQERSTVRLLRKQAGVPVIGPLPYLSGLGKRFDQALQTLAESGEMKQLMKLVLTFEQGSR